MKDDRVLRILVADDELLARQRLEDLIAREAGAELAGVATNGREAVDAIRSLQPDVVFLDVQMPSLTGVQVVREVGAKQMPVTIFVTAYDQYALKAFELAALDYLVKPFDDERFEQALERARELVTLHAVNTATSRLLALLNNTDAKPPATPAASSRPDYLERIAVETRGQTLVVPVEQIDFITASGPYAELHTAQGKYLIREQMSTLAEQLDPSSFFRIHRSTIVRLDCIAALVYNAGGDYAVRLKDNKLLKVSRTRREGLEQRLGLRTST
jgi:two-component system LytT family response regulator